MNLSQILNISPYSLDKTAKDKFFSSFLADLSRHHYSKCESYRKMMDASNFDLKKEYSYQDLPFLPVQLFKTNELFSTSKVNIVKVLSSSGTSGQARSKVFLDKENSANQTRALAKIVSSFLGPKRLPMIIVNSESILDHRNHLSANATGVLGFSLFGSKKIFALNDRLEIDTEQLQSFLEQHKGERVFIFGLTYLVYQYFCKELIRSGTRLNLSNTILIHGGGWKKMESESVTVHEFRKTLHDVCGIDHIHDYYGMVEQTGSIFMQCEHGNYHASVFSNVIIRRPLDFSIADIGEEGIIQVLSLLPSSYPGHSLLTDDKGALLGEDSCPCNRMGRYFRITGRIKNTELRGCSDIHERAAN